ncbi:MAG: hypothetical protein C0404_05025 [Verrucomicrobia bacterium]|nr:hypothetical protein [Verrucomicrobiota bacterium]
MNSLRFEKLSKLDRREPACFAVPCAKGEIKESADFRLIDGKNVVPSQARVTGKWPDGSAKWLFVRAICDLPGNAPKEMRFDLAGKQRAARPPQTVRVSRKADGSLAVDTGRLSLVVPAKGLWPVKDVRLDGKAIWDADPFRGIRAKFGRIGHESRDLDVGLTVEESGPLCAVVRIDVVASEDETVPGMRARLFFWAGMPWFTMNYTVTNRIRALGQFVEVRDWVMDLEPAGQAPLLRASQACYGDRIERSKESVVVRLTADWWRADGCEHQVDCYAHNTWADWQDKRGGVMVSVRHASQNFPKGYVVEPGRMAIELYPPTEADALEWFAGAAKTHELLFHFHGPDCPDAELGCRAAQFQLGDRPSLSPERYGHCGVWPEGIFKGPSSNKLLRYFALVADMRPTALGIFNFGDEPELGYTKQGRGESGVDEGDKQIWLNNEYDLAHHLFLFYARTGERRFLEYALNSARHWMDVDIVHSDVEPRLRGGHLAHCRRHAAQTMVYPSHQWVQGLFDMHHFSGDPDARELALGVAENVRWQSENRGYLKPKSGSTREMGWALRCMLNTWRETGEEKYRKLGEKIEALFVDWGEGAGGGALFAPYTVHSEPRVVFMNALTATSMAMWAFETGSKRAKKLVMAIADDLVENGMTPWGVPYYKELPSLKVATAGFVFVELMSWAYRLSGDKRYLEAGLPALEELPRTEGYHLGAFRKQPIKNGLLMLVESEPAGGKLFAHALAGTLQFVAGSGSKKLAGMLDYQLRL